MGAMPAHSRRKITDVLASFMVDAEPGQAANQ
jgi:hypothetical protein